MDSTVIHSSIFSSLLMPPSINLILIFAGLFLLKKFQRLAIFLIALSASFLLVLSLPSISQTLIASLETSKALPFTSIRQLATNDTNNSAIVVLSAGRKSKPAEYTQIDTVNASSLERIKYAVWLHEKTQIPVLVSGGSLSNEATAESVLMNQVMMSNFDVAPKWIESRSKNTQEQAYYTSEILKANDINEVILITHAWHMNRAAYAFRHNKIKIVEAPISFLSHQENNQQLLIPNVVAFQQSCFAIKELISNALYKFLY